LALPLLTLMLTVGSLAAAPKKSPSSLDKPGATVRFTHTHERVASCKLASDGHSCVEQRVPAMAAAEVALIPEPSELVSQPEPERKAMIIALPSQQGSSARKPPIASDGAKSPALPPEPMVSDAASNFATESASSSATATQPAGNQGEPEIAIWTAP
jgi:hypothetical protein